MPASPVEAEATGQEFVEATFSGTTFQVPLDVDSWPLDTVRRSRGIDDEGEIVVLSVNVVTALREILGAQWPQFQAVARRKKDAVAASHVFAEAVGIPRHKGLRADVAFGGIPRLLDQIELFPRQIESDLNRFWHIDYRHRWQFIQRGPRRGQRRLTLRQIHARLAEGLPVDSALAIVLNDGKLHRTGAELVLMDLYEAITRTPHPSRPMPVAERKARDDNAAAVEQAKAEYRERMKTRHEAGVETARANARVSQRGTAHAQQENSRLLGRSRRADA